MQSSTILPNKLSGFHDVIIDILSYDRKLADNEINYYWALLPNHIKQMAFNWGTNDTVFRDETYIWFEQNKHLKIKESSTDISNTKKCVGCKKRLTIFIIL